MHPFAHKTHRFCGDLENFQAKTVSLCFKTGIFCTFHRKKIESGAEGGNLNLVLILRKGGGRRYILGDIKKVEVIFT